MRINELNIFFYSLIAIALLSPAQFCSIPLGNTFVYWFFAFCIILLIPYVRKMYDSVIQSEDYFFVKCFLIWTFIGVVRGIFIADNYWEYKNMINAIRAFEYDLGKLVDNNEYINIIYDNDYYKEKSQNIEFKFKDNINL